MVRILGRISDKRIFFQDSFTIIDHGNIVGTGAGAATGGDIVNTHLKSVIWGWCTVRNPTAGTPTLSWPVATSGYQLFLKAGSAQAYGYTLDWWAIGYTS